LIFALKHSKILPRRGQKNEGGRQPREAGQKKKIKTNFKRIFMQKAKHKKVKMQSLYRPSVKSLNGYRQVPFFRISGNWLAEVGFSIGSIVEIITSENQLIIKKEI
jgi:hypothetical protein